MRVLFIALFLAMSACRSASYLDFDHSQNIRNAVQGGTVQALKSVLEDESLRIHINTPCPDGLTPLYYALCAEEPDSEKIILLLEHDAKIDVRILGTKAARRLYDIQQKHPKVLQALKEKKQRRIKRSPGYRLLKKLEGIFASR